MHSIRSTSTIFRSHFCYACVEVDEFDQFKGHIRTEAHDDSSKQWVIYESLKREG